MADEATLKKLQENNPYLTDEEFEKRRKQI